NLLPVLANRAAPHSRKLFWRFKAGGLRVVRSGDWKYRRIAGNEFLFDVVQDPRERANLKERYKSVFDSLKNDWETWNAAMLPEQPRPATYNSPGGLLAAHYTVPVGGPVPEGAAQR